MCSPVYVGDEISWSSERCIRKLISRHCLDKTRTRWNDFLFVITDDRDFRPQTCTNGLVFRECKHIKNIFKDVYFTKNSVHITLKKKKNKNKGTTKHRKFRWRDYISNELISKIIWRTNFLFGCLFCFLYFLWIVGVILKYTLV